MHPDRPALALLQRLQAVGDGLLTLGRTSLECLGFGCALCGALLGCLDLPVDRCNGPLESGPSIGQRVSGVVSRRLTRAILRPIAWVAYWLSEALWKYHPPHTTLQLKDAAAAVAAFRILDLDAVWQYDPEWKQSSLPWHIRDTLASFSRKEWDELQNLVAIEEHFLSATFEPPAPRLWGDLSHLRRPAVMLRS